MYSTLYNSTGRVEWLGEVCSWWRKSVPLPPGSVPAGRY